ncbi:hypothetical protein RB595_004988 [Gaeumannomyces hyphopodioides]
MSTYFDGWAWSTNSSSFKCPGMGFECKAPGACARDPSISKWYCCNANSDPFNLCWTGATTCSDDGTTFECRNGQSKWCCTSKREVCTSAANQINICWSTGYDTLKNISVSAIESAHASRSAAAPSSASYISFDPLSLIAQTAPPSSSASTSSSSQTSATGSLTDSVSKTSSTGGPAQTDPAAASQGGTGSSSAGLGTGAIAGIAIGIASGIILAAIVIFFLWRRNKAKSAAATSSPVAMPPTSHSQQQFDNGQYQQLQQSYHPDGTAFGSPHSSEMQGSTPQQPYPYSYYGAESKPAPYPGRPELWGNAPSAELPASNTEASELHGDQTQRPR